MVIQPHRLPNVVKHVSLKQNTQNLVALKRYYVYCIVCAHCILDFPIFFIGVNQSTKYWMKVHVKYMFHTVKWAVQQNFRDKFFPLSVDNGFSSVVLKTHRYGNCRLFYINFQRHQLRCFEYYCLYCALKIYIFVFFSLQLDWAMLHCILDACHPIDHLHNQGQFCSHSS